VPDLTPPTTPDDPASKPTRVLHLIESDGVYGAEQVVLALVRCAARDPLFPAAIGCLVKDVRRPNALHERAGALGLAAVKLPLGTVESPIDVMRLPFTLRRLGIGLLHVHGYKAAIAGYAAHLASRIPIVASCHLWFEESEAKWTYRWLTRLERRLYPRFAHVAGVSAPIAAKLRRWHVPDARLSEIGNGIVIDDAERPADRGATLRRELGLAADAFVVMNVGRLAEQKAQADLIAAAARVRAAHPNLQVLILGEGHLRAALDAQIAAAGLRDSVRILGFKQNVGDYLAIADAFALSSVDEGLPIALLEALAAGVPAVCTPVGATPGFLEHGVSVLFVPVHALDELAAALQRLIEEPELRAALAVRGREAVRRAHSAETMYQRYRDIYSRVMGHGRTRR
jgi:glycosyltransferase involved in cell wall biosynthesis